MSRFLHITAAVVLASTATGCMSASSHAKSLQSEKEREMTVGTVQKEVRTGMSQADVAATLGSPNIVTRDAYNAETWIYDKIASEASYSSSTGGGGIGVSAGGLLGKALLLGGVNAGGSRSAGAVSSTQKTLTVIIKFNTQGNVESFNYHSSKF